MPGLSEGTAPFGFLPETYTGGPPSDHSGLNGMHYEYVVSNGYLGPTVGTDASGAVSFNPSSDNFYAYPGIYECPDVAFIDDGLESRVDLNQCYLATAWHLEPYRMKLIRDAEILAELGDGESLPPGLRRPPDAHMPSYDVQPTWLPAHQAWNHWEPSGEGRHFHSEHADIAEVAADAAGLLAFTTIFDRFFLRYPTSNRMVATKQAAGTSSTQYFTVGQSFAPNGHLSTDANVDEFAIPSALATRGVSLLELVQLPDFSHSLMDWANGNETCPEALLAAGMYRDQDPVHSCHEFKRVLGSVNASHFYPLARSFYEHYHTLAKQRMGQCGDAELATLVDAYFWPDDAPLRSATDMGISPKHTPGHICEREAMAYEMVAQHFLQDGWSTGHMWHRWGYPELGQFNYALPGETVSDIPESNKQPRRGAIAMLTAIAAGQIHGARAVVERQIRENVGEAWLAEFILSRGLVDDPLSAPLLQDRDALLGGPILTSWIPGSTPEGGVSDQAIPGAGDLYWNPIRAVWKDPPLSNPDNEPGEYLQIRWARTYEQQRTRMVACSAASMLEVYLSGAQLHGRFEPGPIYYDSPLNEGDPVLLVGADGQLGVTTTGDYCWGQLATNLSMEQATGITPELLVLKDPTFKTKLSQGDIAKALINVYGRNLIGLVANWVVLEQEAKGALDFHSSLSPEVPFPENVPCTDYTYPVDRICDRERFITGSKLGGAVGERLILDSLHVMAQFQLNKFYSGSSSSAQFQRQNARLMDVFDGSINMLGVPPSNEWMVYEGTEKKDPIVPYVDVAVESYDDFTPLQHVFWRGRLTEICEYTADNWSKVEELRAACQEGTRNGGNVPACTSCVEMASLHAPIREMAPAVSHLAANQTACSLVGTYELEYVEGANLIAGAPPDLPVEWFEEEQSNPGPWEVTYDHGWTPGKVAFHWCTGVPNVLEGEDHAVGWSIPPETDGRSHNGCSFPNPAGRYSSYGNYEKVSAWSEGLRFNNSLALGYPPEGQHHIHDLKQFLPEVVAIREKLTDALTPSCTEYPPYFTRTSSDFDSRIEQVLGVLPYVDSAAYGTHVIQGSKVGIYAPVCGESMGYSAWSVSCDDARAYMESTGHFRSFVPEITEAPPGESWNPSYAQFISVGGGKCVVREPSRFRKCPQGSECGADGRCRLNSGACFDLSCEKPIVQMIQ